MRTLAYGSWPSPIDATLAATHDGRPEYVGFVGDEVWWTEPRPTEGGRRTLVRRRADGAQEPVLPAPWNVRSRVIEYGGQPWAGAVVDGEPLVVFVHFADQRLYRYRPGGEPLPLTPLSPVTLHGPMAAGIDFVKNARAQEHLKATLFAPETVRVITSGGTALVPGRAAGVTLGGCLSLLAAELGTPHARAGAHGGLLCLEDVGEETYRLDRYLTQLLRAGWLDGVRGVLLGSWERCEAYDDVRALLADRLGGLGVPVVEEFGFGHCDGAWTIPFGVAAELDADAGTLTLREPALR
ncbi:hypothetical protein SALBM311S_11978 [Streptomyces alboniger]